MADRKPFVSQPMKDRFLSIEKTYIQSKTL